MILEIFLHNWAFDYFRLLLINFEIFQTNQRVSPNRSWYMVSQKKRLLIYHAQWTQIPRLTHFSGPWIPQQVVNSASITWCPRKKYSLSTSSSISKRHHVNTYLSIDAIWLTFKKTTVNFSTLTADLKKFFYIAVTSILLSRKHIDLISS